MTLKFNKGLRRQDDVLIAVGAGKVDSVRGETVSGSASLPAADTTYTIKENPTVPVYYPPITGEIMDIASTNAADTDLLYAITGLDENLEHAETTVVVTGTTPAIIPGLWSRVNTLRNIGSKAGLGTINVTGSGLVVIAATPEFQKSSQAVYTVPSNQRVQILSLISAMQRSDGNQDAGASVVVRIRTDLTGGVFTREFSLDLQRRGVTATEVYDQLPAVIEGPVDIIAEASATSTDVSVLVRMALLLEDK